MDDTRLSMPEGLRVGNEERESYEIVFRNERGFKFDEVDDDIKIAKKKYQTFFKKTL